ncbi:MAG TPA: PilZ domain-containing protein [Blastocatellia bacterium]|nr:PilZ domain-containing protein [Blastocatellia bacterium]
MNELKEESVHESGTAGPEFNIEQLSAFYFKLEQKLEGVERATSHYQALELDRSATTEEVLLAYEQAMDLLKPSQHGIDLGLDETMLARLEKALEKVSLAFSVLTDTARRAQYNNSLRIIAPPPAGGQAESEKPGAPVRVAPKERRSHERLKMSLPVQVTGRDRAEGEWREDTQTVDVSSAGVGLRLRRRVRHGAVLTLELPMPKKLRNHGHSQKLYKVYAVVRHIQPVAYGKRLVGLEFLGEHPPVSYLNYPWAPYRGRDWDGAERRREPRTNRSGAVKVEYVDEQLQAIKEEVTIIENISRSGARVYIKAPPPEFEMVRVINRDGSFESLAVICNRYVGKDGFERLCLRFVEKQWEL